MFRSLVWLSILALVVVAGLLAFRFQAERDDEAPVGRRSFEGDSTRLQHTAFVPTLDTPIPDGHSAVWCASFQLAWDKLKTDVVKGPVEITNAEAVCDRLNKSDPAKDDLTPESFYAAAGFEKDGIRETIRAEMARKFPNAPSPDLPAQQEGIYAYAYLEANVRFKRPYPINPKPFLFQEPGEKAHPVDSFGIPHERGIKGEGNVAPPETRAQATVLFVEEHDDRNEKLTFAIDLDRNSRPNQAVLARIDRRETLAETLAEVERQIHAFDSKPKERWQTEDLGPLDTLLVPNMSWKVHHQFTELLGPDKMLKLNGDQWPVADAEQTVAFQLDSRGAGVESSANLRFKSVSRDYRFDRPFLVYLKRRDSARPFFVMWVANAELLCTSE